LFVDVPCLLWFSVDRAIAEDLRRVGGQLWGLAMHDQYEQRLGECVSKGLLSASDMDQLSESALRCVRKASQSTLEQQLSKAINDLQIMQNNQDLQAMQHHIAAAVQQPEFNIKCPLVAMASGVREEVSF
jgi:hypothetical protein